MQSTSTAIGNTPATPIDKLRDLARKEAAPSRGLPRGSKKEFVAGFLDTLVDMRDRGHTYESICVFLKRHGHSFTPAVLKAYVSELRPKSGLSAAKQSTKARNVNGGVTQAVVPRPAKPAEPAVPRTPELRPRVPSLPPQTPLDDL